MNISMYLSSIRTALKRMVQTSRYTANRTVALRMQGFVAGIMLVGVLMLILRFIPPSLPPESYQAWYQAQQTAWATAILAGLFYALLVVAIDLNEKEPYRLLVLALLWGCIASPALSGILKRIGIAITGWESGQVAPFTEELAKSLILFILFYRLPHEFDGALDGIIYGALVGIGFAMTENAGYFFRKDPSPTIIAQMQTKQFFLRVILGGLTSHATATAITGLLLGLVRENAKRRFKYVFPLIGLAAAITVHSMWNSDVLKASISAMTDSWKWRYTIRTLLVPGPFVLGLLAALTLALRKEKKVINKYLRGELSPDNPFTSLAKMNGVWARFKVGWPLLRQGNISAWWTLRRLQRALVELAFFKWHCEKDLSSKDLLAVYRRPINELRDRLRNQLLDDGISDRQ